MYDARGIEKLVWGFEYQELRFKTYHPKPEASLFLLYHFPQRNNAQ